jgi:2-amino-4-hydroxy-6-hydroxymethyldihydropteridine diphosphokinase
VVGLGSNVGDRLDYLSRARAGIAAFATELAASSIHETAPVGGPSQGDFLNAALLVEFAGAPRALLDALLGLERELGRDRSEDAVRWGPRVIDLDLLLVVGVVLDEPGLTVPHPRLHERAFALVPLLEVLPDAIDPRTSARFVAAPGELTFRAAPERW